MLPEIRMRSVLRKSPLSHEELMQIYRGTVGEQERTGTGG
jgi:hypothetical protein